MFEEAAKETLNAAITGRSASVLQLQYGIFVRFTMNLWAMFALDTSIWLAPMGLSGQIHMACGWSIWFFLIIPLLGKVFESATSFFLDTNSFAGEITAMCCMGIACTGVLFTLLLLLPVLLHENYLWKLLVLAIGGAWLRLMYCPKQDCLSVRRRSKFGTNAEPIHDGDNEQHDGVGYLHSDHSIIELENEHAMDGVHPYLTTSCDADQNDCVLSDSDVSYDAAQKDCDLSDSDAFYNGEVLDERIALPPPPKGKLSL